MRVNGIIAEYNPFHNGHKYHLETLKKKTGADYTVIVMSGNFTQRGTPALFPKHERAHMALLNGADLVLELPLYYSCGSAEYFSKGAVALFDKLGIINYIGFGSEVGNIQDLMAIAKILQAEPPLYQSMLKKKLREGLTYPQARSLALSACFPESDGFESLLASPNNILGIEYCRALLSRTSSIEPVTIKRNGADYHASFLTTNGRHSSALALRTALFEDDNLSSCDGHMPDSALSVLSEHWKKRGPVFETDLSHLLHYKLLSETAKGFTDYVDVSSELSDRILRKLPEYLSFPQFCNLIKTREMTYTRISRCLLHILLDIKKTSLSEYIALDYVPYARILGFRKTAVPLLHEIKQHSSIPLISKLADASSLLSEKAYRMLLDDIRAAHLYETILTDKYSIPVKNEFSKEILMIP